MKKGFVKKAVGVLMAVVVTLAIVPMMPYEVQAAEDYPAIIAPRDIRPASPGKGGGE